MDISANFHFGKIIDVEYGENVKNIQNEPQIKISNFFKSIMTAIQESNSYPDCPISEINKIFLEINGTSSRIYVKCGDKSNLIDVTKRVLEEASKDHDTEITDFYQKIQENSVDVASDINPLPSNYMDQAIKIISTIKSEPTVRFLKLEKLIRKSEEIKNKIATFQKEHPEKEFNINKNLIEVNNGHLKVGNNISGEVQKNELFVIHNKTDNEQIWKITNDVVTNLLNYLIQVTEIIDRKDQSSDIKIGVQHDLKNLIGHEGSQNLIRKALEHELREMYYCPSDDFFKHQKNVSELFGFYRLIETEIMDKVYSDFNINPDSNSVRNLSQQYEDLINSISKLENKITDELYQQFINCLNLMVNNKFEISGCWFLSRERNALNIIKEYQTNKRSPTMSKEQIKNDEMEKEYLEKFLKINLQKGDEFKINNKDPFEIVDQYMESVKICEKVSPILLPHETLSRNEVSDYISTSREMSTMVNKLYELNSSESEIPPGQKKSYLELLKFVNLYEWDWHWLIAKGVQNVEENKLASSLFDHSKDRHLSNIRILKAITEDLKKREDNYYDLDATTERRKQLPQLDDINNVLSMPRNSILHNKIEFTNNDANSSLDNHVGLWAYKLFNERVIQAKALKDKTAPEQLRAITSLQNNFNSNFFTFTNESEIDLNLEQLRQEFPSYEFIHNYMNIPIARNLTGPKTAGECIYVANHQLSRYFEITSMSYKQLLAGEFKMADLPLNDLKKVETLQSKLVESYNELCEVDDERAFIANEINKFQTNQSLINYLEGLKAGNSEGLDSLSANQEFFEELLEQLKMELPSKEKQEEYAANLISAQKDVSSKFKYVEIRFEQLIGMQIRLLCGGYALPKELNAINFKAFDISDYRPEEELPPMPSGGF